jgi:uncharacterized protein (UPF0212 family)
MKDNQLKTLMPSTCPHCQTPILLELLSTTPTLVGILTAESIMDAKKTAAKEVASISIDTTTKKEALDWINNETTIFSPSDIPQIVANLLEPKDN